jgi:hypothetical protein
LHDKLKELVFLTGLLTRIKFGALCNSFFDFLFEHSFMLGYDENMGDAFLHRDGDQVALVFLLDHLVQPHHVDGVEIALYYHYLAGWLDVHRLSHA